MPVSEDFTPTEISDQLIRILSASTFKGSPVLSAFLKFVVDETLGGREQEIKEYTIGINVLSRKTDFNPQLDAIVRTHAGRLRRALKEYYYEIGMNDPISIEIPKGSYIPSFQSKRIIPLSDPSNAIDHTIDVRSKPVIAVLPFRTISRSNSRDLFAEGLAEQLSSELTQFQDLAVISFYSSRHVAEKTNDIRESSILLGAQYLLTGSIQRDNKHLRIWVQLILGDNGRQIWSSSFDRKNTASDLYEIQNEIVKSTLTAIGGYFGAIFRDALDTPQGRVVRKKETYDAIFCYYHYQKVFSKAAFDEAITTLQAAVEADPNYALAWAMLGELWLDDKALEFTKGNNQAEEGMKYALRAVTIDPNCQHAYMALTWIHLFYHNREECLKAAYKCISINPNSVDKVGAMGFGLICAGEFEKGYEFLKDSTLHNPYCPWYFYLGYSMYFLYKKEYPQAFHYAEKINIADVIWNPIMKASALGHLNRIPEAKLQIELILVLMPDAPDRIVELVESFILSPEVIHEILEGLRKAGLHRGQLRVNGELKPSAIQ